MAKKQTVRSKKSKPCNVEDAPNAERETVTSEDTEVEMRHDEQKDGDEQDLQVDGCIKVKRNVTTVEVSWEEDKVEGEVDEIETGCRPILGKRIAEPVADTSPSKKTKLKNDGVCLFVGNLNSSKTHQEITDSLAKYFMSQSLLFQNIRLGRSKKHAFVDMASEMDLTKALELDGTKILDMPLKLAKAKIKNEEKVEKVKAPVDQKVKDGRCLFLKNVPYNATKEDILKVFRKAVAVRFPGRTTSPDKGIAFVEFKNKSIAKKVLWKSRKAQLLGQDLIVACVGQRSLPETHSSSKAARTTVLFVRHLPSKVTEKRLKKVFKEAVRISIPRENNRPKGYAFVEFPTLTHAEKVLQSSKDLKICKKAVKIEVCLNKKKPENAKMLKTTLFVGGLSEKTTAETLQRTFEGAISTRVALHKDSGVSRRFGFVDYETEESCRAAKEALEDCEIDGSRVTVMYALSKSECTGEAGNSPAGGHEYKQDTNTTGQE